jgi:hypothetical protein
LTPLCGDAYRPSVRLWLAAVWMLGATADPDLAVAERAYEDARFEDVLPALKSALEHPLGESDLARALELRALTEAAFDNRAASVDAFRHLLGIRPSYEPDAAAGPKVRNLWDRARRLGPIGGTEPPPPAAKPPPAPPPHHVAPKPLPPAALPTADEGATAPSPAWYERWYVWGGLGAVVAAGIVIGVAAANHPVAPSGNLGTGNLQ